MLFRVIGGKLHPAFAESVRLMRRMVAPVPALSCCHPALCSCAQPSLRPSLDSNAVSSSLSNDVHEEVGLVLLAGSPAQGGLRKDAEGRCGREDRRLELRVPQSGCIR